MFPVRSECRANASAPSALVKALVFETIQTGAVKISWDDYRLGLFGVPNGSMCRYQAFIDNTLWGGERRIEVNGASTVPTTDHGTYTSLDRYWPPGSITSVCM